MTKQKWNMEVITKKPKRFLVTKIESTSHFLEDISKIP